MMERGCAVVSAGDAGTEIFRGGATSALIPDISFPDWQGTSVVIPAWMSE
jgi:hypothetical protein